MGNVMMNATFQFFCMISMIAVMITSMIMNVMFAYAMPVEQDTVQFKIVPAL